MYKTSKEVQEYYDGAIKDQISKAFNERHFAVVDRFKAFNISPNANILEIGCGIGAVSYLIAKIINKGKIVSCDISADSIKVAKILNCNNPKILFEANDIFSKDTLKDGSFDYILLFDVLEHIPVEKHDKLFNLLRKKIKPEGKVFINIPNPQHTAYLRKTDPKALQIIDEEVDIAALIKVNQKNGFVLFSFENYDLWLKEQYLFIVFSAHKEYKSLENNKHFRNRSLSNYFRKMKTRWLISNFIKKL